MMKKLAVLALSVIFMFCAVSCAQNGAENETGSEVKNETAVGSESESKTEPATEVGNETESERESAPREPVSEEPQEEKVAPVAEEEDLPAGIYDELLGQICRAIAEGTTESGEPEGVFSLYASLGHMTADEMLAATGYAVEDINRDGIPEMILGMITEIDGDRAVGNILYTVYTWADGKPVVVFESFVRNSYTLLEDGMFYYYGSGSAANAGFGIFALPAEETALACEGFWFYDVKAGTDDEIGYYHNTSGSWNAEESEELSTTMDDFWVMSGEYSEQGREIVFTPFDRWEKAETVG